MVEPPLTLAPVVVNVATRDVTFVPEGIVTAIVFHVSSIVPATPSRENDVIDFADIDATVTVIV